MFVEKTDLEGRPWNIPHLEEVSEEEFNSFVDFVEEEALVNLLGRSFYDSMIAGIGVPDAKFVAIRDGADYIYDSITYSYKGLRDLLTPLVYAKWIEENALEYNGTSATIPEAQNAIIVNPDKLIVKGWNEYVQKLGRAYKQPYKQRWYWPVYNYGGIAEASTLYGLLKSNSNYPDYDYNVPDYINTFGI